MSTSAIRTRTRLSTALEPDMPEVPSLASHLRTFRMSDYEQVIDLWLRTGIKVGPTDSREGIQHALQRNADLFLVADDGVRVVGSVMGTYDGQRGWANHVAVDPQWQGKGVGAALMRELENRLRACGCTRFNLTVARANARVQGFYQQLGFDPDDVIFMQKWL